MAFEPVFVRPKNYWFIETLTLGAIKLPQGVEVLTSNSSSEPRRSLIVKNRTDTLLFVMSLRYKDVLVMATPDPDWKARVNAAQEVASYLVAPNRPAYLSIEALTDLDQNLVDRNVLTFDPPPTDVPIPDSQSSELLLIYGEQVIEVPFKLGYTLNTNFNNGSQAYPNAVTNIQSADNTSAAATQQAQGSAVQAHKDNIMIIVLIGGVVLVIAGWLAWRRLNRSKEDA